MNNPNSVGSDSWNINQSSDSSGGQKIRVYLDESASEDGNLYCLGGVYVRLEDVDSLDQDIEGLRRKLSEEMQRLGYHNLKRDGNGEMELPEIHAQHLWQSKGAFDKDRASDPDLKERHIGWLEEMLQFIDKYEVATKIFGTSDLEKYKQLSRDDGQQRMSDAFRHILPEKVNLKKFNEIQEDASIIMMAESLIKLESEMVMKGFLGEIIADKGRKHESFELLNTFEYLREYGFWGNFLQPRFLDSESENLLQLADCVVFIARKNWENQRSGKIDPEIERLFNTYIEPNMATYNPSQAGTAFPPRQHFLMGAMTLELAFVRISGNSVEREKFREIARREVLSKLSEFGIHPNSK